MGLIRSAFSKTVRWALTRQGIFVGQRTSYGLDPMMDIRRLARLWNYPINVIFDVGANNGDTAVVLLKEQPNAAVMSFEPHPATFAELVQRIGANDRFKAFNLALGEKEGEVEMTEYENSKVNSLVPNAQFVQRFEQKGQSIKVQATTLDIFSETHSIDKIDILKIDTEGYELMVLEGSVSLLSKHSVKFIYFEFNDLFVKQGSSGGAFLPIASLLNEYGYRFVATYNDYIATEGEMFCVCNALFALPPMSS